MLGVAKKLRQERERERELQTQKGDQRTAIQHTDQRVARMEAQLKDSRQQVGTYSEGRVIGSILVQSGAETCAKGFVICFLQVPLASLGSMAAAVKPKGLGNSHKK